MVVTATSTYRNSRNSRNSTSSRVSRSGPDGKDLTEEERLNQSNKRCDYLLNKELNDKEKVKEKKKEKNRDTLAAMVRYKVWRMASTS